MRGSTNRLAFEKKQIAAEKLGLKNVVSLCPKPDNDWFSIVPNYMYRYFPDGKQIPDWLLMTAQHIADDGRPTLVYCYGGVNRSALLAALIYREYHGCDGETAEAWVRHVKPHVLDNMEFVAFLRELPAASGY